MNCRRSEKSGAGETRSFITLRLTNQKIAIAKLGEIYDFVGRFLVHQLNVDLKRVISPDLYKKAAALIGEWKEVVRVARLKAIEAGQTVLVDACPRCGAEKVLTKAMGGAVTCHLCGMALHSGTCPVCYKEAVGYTTGDEEGEVSHDDCLNSYAWDTWDRT